MSDKQPAPHGHDQSVGGPVIVLVEPQLGQNIGATARAMANFGLARLRIVAPRDGWPSEEAHAAASGADAILEAAELFDTAADAVADLHYVLATTARRRDMIKPVASLESAAATLDQRIGRGEACGILFGRERWGLDNDQVALADAVVMAPVNPAFASINLAQAVLLMGYEWFKRRGGSGLGRKTAVEAGASEGLWLADTRPATKAELAGLFEHLESELDASGFLRPPEKRPTMVRNLRNMLQREGLTEQDVRTLRGVIASLTRPRRPPGDR